MVILPSLLSIHGRAGSSDRLIDLFLELLEGLRLYDVAAGGAADGPSDIAHKGGGGYEHDGHLAHLAHLSHRLQELEAVNSRHADVEKDQRRPQPPGRDLHQ